MLYAFSEIRISWYADCVDVRVFIENDFVSCTNT